MTVAPRPAVKTEGIALEVECLRTGAVRAALDEGGVAAVVARNSPPPFGQADLAALAALDGGFRFSHSGGAVAGRLRQALRRAGVASHRAAEALAAEIEQLARVLGGVANDLEPWVQVVLVVGGETSAPPGVGLERAARAGGGENGTAETANGTGGGKGTVGAEGEAPSAAAGAAGTAEETPGAQLALLREIGFAAAPRRWSAEELETAFPVLTGALPLTELPAGGVVVTRLDQGCGPAPVARLRPVSAERPVGPPRGLDVEPCATAAGRVGERTASPRLLLCITSHASPLAGSEAPLVAAGARPEPVDVALISMPFGPLRQPSLALSLLQAQLAGLRSEVLYFTLPFARRIGLPWYEWITECEPFVSALLGEWLFRSTLYAESAAEAEGYLREVLGAPTQRWRVEGRATKPGRRRGRKARPGATGGAAADPARGGDEAGADPSFITLVTDETVAELLAIRATMSGFLDECAAAVLARRPRVVGFTSVFQQHLASLALARRLKERAPELAIVFGGANCEGVMGLETVRQAPWVDAVVCGEGDVVFRPLVDRLLAGDWRAGTSPVARVPADGATAAEPLADLQGVYTAASAAVRERAPRPANAASPASMDALPYPVFDDFFAQWNGAALSGRLAPRLLLETSRGCWWGAKQHCTFCGLNGTTMTYRSKSPERALDELLTLVRRYPTSSIGTADNILDMRYFQTLLPALAAEELDLNLFYEVKANLKREQVKLLRAAGVREIQPGIESFSDEVLTLMRKGARGMQNIELLKWCQLYGVLPLYNLIWGFPGEPVAEYEVMAQLLPLLAHLPPPAGMSKIFLERFSPNHEQSARFGFADVAPTAAYRHIYPFDDAALDRIAYYFSYRHADGRDVVAYTRPLTERIIEWRAAHEGSRLVVIDRGDHLILGDTRPLAVRPLTFVDGLARQLYLAAETSCTLDQLAARVAAGGATPSGTEIEQQVQPLIDEGFLLRQGDWVLALAVPQTLGSSAAEAA
jgi:ribosomal peptide maturation radical SAM protein 1